MGERICICIGICGPTGSGKTEFTAALGVAVAKDPDFGDGTFEFIRSDDFYLDLNHMSPEKRRRQDFDDPKMIEWEGEYGVKIVVQKLKKGRRAYLPEYSFAENTRKLNKATPIPSTKKDPLSLRIIFLEGLYVVKEAPEVLDYSIFVECKTDDRYARREKRDVTERDKTVEDVKKGFANAERWKETVYGQTESVHCVFHNNQEKWRIWLYAQELWEKDIKPRFFAPVGADSSESVPRTSARSGPYVL